MMHHDVLTTAWDRSENGEPLLVEVVRDGRIVRETEGLREIRARFQDQYSRLPAGLKDLEPAEHYNVVIGSALLELEEKTAAARRIES
jgi:hypothetical protein